MNTGVLVHLHFTMGKFVSTLTVRSSNRNDMLACSCEGVVYERKRHVSLTDQLSVCAVNTDDWTAQF